MELEQLTEEEFEFFANMTEEEWENYCSSISRFRELEIIQHKVDCGELLFEDYEQDLLDLRILVNNNPHPDCARQQLMIMRGEDCPTC